MKRFPLNVSLVNRKPTPNRDHVALAAVAPLCVEHDGENFYPEFQADPETNALYYNVATCIALFRSKAPLVSTLDILLWFSAPNEYLEGKTPLEVGAHPNKEIRTQIIEAAEMDSPLNNKTASTW